MKQVELGKLCDTMSERDAIHLALYPCIAGETLQPGQRVGVSRVSGNALGSVPWIGVVDPFLSAPVEKGQRFWLCIRPGEVTGLRHVYTHPAFDRSEAKVEPKVEVPWEIDITKYSPFHYRASPDGDANWQWLSADTHKGFGAYYLEGYIFSRLKSGHPGDDRALPFMRVYWTKQEAMDDLKQAVEEAQKFIKGKSIVVKQDRDREWVVQTTRGTLIIAASTYEEAEAIAVRDESRVNSSHSGGV